jgi:hypothetical protein
MKSAIAILAIFAASASAQTPNMTALFPPRKAPSQFTKVSFEIHLNCVIPMMPPSPQPVWLKR